VILLDVNVLIYAHREDAERRKEYRAWLERALRGSDPCAVSELALAGCLGILTHPGVFVPPTPLRAALDCVRQIREHPNVSILAPGRRHWAIFTDLCLRAAARGNLVSDAYHAALAMESGCDWVTTDRDYARFPGLRCRRPLEPQQSKASGTQRTSGT
jgi:hypothetical protein